MSGVPSAARMTSSATTVGSAHANRGREASAFVPHVTLLGEPGVETLFQLVAMVGPELRVDVEGSLQVVRRCRQVGQRLGIDVGDRVLVRRTIGDELRLVSHAAAASEAKAMKR